MIDHVAGLKYCFTKQGSGAGPRNGTLAIYASLLFESRGKVVMDYVNGARGFLGAPSQCYPAIPETAEPLTTLSTSWGNNTIFATFGPLHLTGYTVVQWLHRPARLLANPLHSANDYKHAILTAPTGAN